MPRGQAGETRLTLAVQQIVEHLVEGGLGVFQFLERCVEGLQRELRRTAVAFRRELRLKRILRLVPVLVSSKAPF